MNLAVSNQSHVAAAVAAVNNAATTLDTSALLYQQNDHHQQQPISYKIPQVNELAEQFSGVGKSTMWAKAGQWL